MAAAAALADVHQCLEWIGFGDVQHRNAIIDEGGFDRLTDFYDINETDIRDMAESFSKRSPAANRIIFGIRRIKWLISMMHWTQDHQQVDRLLRHQRNGHQRHGGKLLKAIPCRQSHYLRYTEDQVAHINDALDSRSPAMF